MDKRIERAIDAEQSRVDAALPSGKRVAQSIVNDFPEPIEPKAVRESIHASAVGPTLGEIQTPDISRKPRVSVLSRRLKNPHGIPAGAIELRDASLEPRWFNGDIAADKIWRAKHNGWEPVTPSDLVDRDQVGGFGVSPDGYVTRGARHQEVLMCMPRDERDQIERAKARVNLAKMNDRRPVVEAAGQTFGEEAANFVQNSRLVGQVTDNLERIQVTPESAD